MTFKSLAIALAVIGTQAVKIESESELMAVDCVVVCGITALTVVAGVCAKVQDEINKNSYWPPENKSKKRPRGRICSDSDKRRH